MISSINSYSAPKTSSCWNHLVALTEDRLDAGTAIRHRPQFVANAGQVHIDAAIEARERTAQRLLG